MAHRIERVNSLIRQELSELLQREVKDPRLGSFIAITEVSTTPDMRFTRVFVSSMEEDTDRQAVLKALNSAAGYFRSQLAKNLKMRYTPEVSFRWDSSIERADRLLRLIDEVARNED